RLTEAPASPLPIKGSIDRRQYTGDFNEDGHLDLAVLNGTSLTLWLGDGAGGFSPAPKSVTVPNPSSLAIADFNLDGYLDVAVASGSVAGNSMNSQVQVFWGDGAG